MSSEIEHLPTFTQDILDIWETRVRSNPIAHSICVHLAQVAGYVGIDAKRGIGADRHRQRLRQLR